MKSFLKKLSYFSFFLVFSVFSEAFVFSEDFSDNETASGKNGYVIDYFGVISNDLDLNMSTMISDLYYTQLSEIPNFTVYDKRIFPKNKEPSYADQMGTTNTIFYTKIIKNEEEETWTLSYIVIDSNKKTPFSKKKNYDSFYKILMESKNELETSVKDLIKKGNAGQNQDRNNNFFEDNGFAISEGGDFFEGSNFISENKENDSIAKKSDSNVKPSSENSKKLNIKSLEALSGTWKGEDYIDKIVILRGGRGFIIFNNGASMNISISIEETSEGQIINVKQKGNSNASFYPDLPRKTALAAAVSAPPMEWSMILLDNMVLEGTKTTLVQDNEGFKVSEVPVSWHKIN